MAIETSVIAIAAVARDGTIGDNGSLPWDDYGADLKRFRMTTYGHPVVMGRLTFESIIDRLGHPLEGRPTLVLTTTAAGYAHDEVYARRSVDDALRSASSFGTGKAYIAGGETVYEQALPKCDMALITRIPEDPGGDATWPGLNPADGWELVTEEAGPDGLVFEVYER